MSLEIQTQKITISLYEKKNLNNTNIINNLFSVNIPNAICVDRIVYQDL